MLLRRVPRREQNGRNEDMNFKNMSIKKSLIVGFGTTIVISAIIIIAQPAGCGPLR